MLSLVKVFVVVILATLQNSDAVPRRLRVSKQQTIGSVSLIGREMTEHRRYIARYLPKNYTDAMSKHAKELKKQVFNTTKEVKSPLEAGKKRRAEWEEEQRILHELIEKRIKNVTDCIGIETKNQSKRFKVCNETLTKNIALAAKDPPEDPVPEPEECSEYHNIYEFCDQPPVPINISQGKFGNELMEVARMHEALEAAAAGWVERTHNEEIQLLNEVRRFFSQKKSLNRMQDVKAAREHALKGVESQKAVVQKLVNDRQAAYAEDKRWFTGIADHATDLLKTVCDGNTTVTCLKPQDRIVLEAAEDTIETQRWALFRHDKDKEEKAENTPWDLPSMRELMAWLPNETADINSKSWPHEDSWWKGAKLPNLGRLSNPGWHWDERRAHELAVMDGLETILQNGEKYFDYQFANLLVHIGTRKAQITELRIQPALREVGILPKEDPDMAGIELIQKEIELLYKLAVAERKYHWEEQSRIWSLKPFLDAATRDMDKPEAVYKWCQITSLRWYKCRQSSRQLLDYLQDTTAFLNLAAKPLREIRNEISYKYDPLYKEKDWVSHVVDEMNGRLTELYKMWEDIGKAEVLAQGDGDAKKLEAMKTKMNAVLAKANEDVEPLFSNAASWSRKFHLKTVQRIIDLMEKKQLIIEDWFYGGETDMAERNRDAFKRMTAPDLWLMNVTGMNVGTPWILQSQGAKVFGSTSEGLARFLRVPSATPEGQHMTEDTPSKEYKQGGFQRVLQLLHMTPISIQ